MLGWVKSWNKIIREVIFKDEDLRFLMRLPARTHITKFIDQYFVQAGFTNKLLTNETVRIVYSDTQVGNTDVPNIKKDIMTFDIYVKQENMYDVGDDRLIARTYLIADRLEKILTKSRYINDTGYRFWPAGSWDQGTRTTGYSRYTISFYFMKVY